MSRLYEAAKALQGIDGQSAVAKILNVSPQTIHNWEDRGISQDGLLKAQEILGCDAIWLRDKTGQMIAGSGEIEIDEIIELMTLYQQATARGRSSILAFAKSAAKSGAIRWARNASNKT